MPQSERNVLHSIFLLVSFVVDCINQVKYQIYQSFLAVCVLSFKNRSRLMPFSCKNELETIKIRTSIYIVYIKCTFVDVIFCTKENHAEVG